MENDYANYTLLNKGEVLTYTIGKGKLKSLNIQPFGTCYCSLLNNVYKLENFFTKFKKDYSNRKDVDKKFIKNIVQNLKIINPYFEVLGIELTKTKNIDEINHILEYTIMILKKSDNFYYDLKMGNQSFGLPAMSVQSNNGNEYFKSYSIKNIRELMQLCSYILFHNKFHLKKCNYCGRYFVTRRNQTRFCNNPSPVNPRKTCREIPKRIYNDNYDDENTISESPIFKAIYELEPLYIKIKTNFYDSCKRENNKKQKEYIKLNRKEFMRIAKTFKKKIKGNSPINRDTLIKNYSEFLGNIYNNLKAKPKIFKVEEPKIKLFNDLR